MGKTILIITMVFCSFVLEAQEYTTSNKKAIKLYNQANELLRARQFYAALVELSKATDKDPQFTEAYLKIAGYTSETGRFCEGGTIF